MQQEFEEQGLPPHPALQQAADRVIRQQVQCTAIPKRFSIPMREIWEMQLRLPKTQSKRVHELAQHPRFRAAYDFVLLREQSGEDLKGLGDWWTQYQEKHPIPQKTHHRDPHHRGPHSRGSGNEQDREQQGEQRRRRPRRKPRSQRPQS